MSFTQTITDAINMADIASKNNTMKDRSIWDRYLDALPDDELKMLKAFMYFGRNAEEISADAIVGNRDVLSHNRVDSSRHITDIAVSGYLATYLRDGLAKSANLNIDIDKLI